MVKSTVVKSKEEKSIEGFALAIAFLLGSFLLYFFPEFIGNSVISIILVGVYLAIGFIGFCVEFGKINKKTYLGTSDIGIGIFLFALCSIIYYFTLPNNTPIMIAIRTFVFFFYLISFYAIVGGIIKFIYSVYTANRKKQKNVVLGGLKIVLLLVCELAGLGASILTIIDLL